MCTNFLFFKSKIDYVLGQFLNHILSESSEKFKVGHGIHSCTQEVEVHVGSFGKKSLVLVDTPGFDDTTKR